MSDERGAQNPVVRAAVEAFGAAPSQQTSIDVLRACLCGFLLFDGTGSQLRYRDGDPGVLEAGSTIRIATANGPDGRSALLAFTSHAEVARVHPPGTEVQSLVQPAAGVLEFAREHGHGWVYVDPAGPTCALSDREIDFALRTPRNDAVGAALEPGAPREQLLSALAEDGPLLLAVDSADAPASGVLDAPTQLRVRSTTTPDGDTALVAFTSGPEVVARHPQDAFVTQSTAEVLARVRAGGFAGLVLNPAGPWAFVPTGELPLK